MARIKTYYDYEIKKEAFEVLGDVGYTKSTDITLTPVSFSNSRIEYGVQTFTVDVVGEKGTSNIIVYDNDEPIPIFVGGLQTDMIDWSEEDPELTFNVHLNYDVEHNLRARFKGNDRCLGSKSRLITITEPTPDAYSSTIRRYNDSTVNYTPNSAFSLPIEFVSGQSFVKAEVKSVEWFIDDVSQGTTNITLPANTDRGNTTLEVNGLTDGSHTIRINFEGDEHSGASELTFNISVGYLIQILSYSPYSVNFENVNIRARLENYLGQGIANQTIWDVTTDSNGEVNISRPYPHEPASVVSERRWTFRLPTTIDDVTYYSDYITIVLYPDVTVSLTADTLITSQNYQSTITATVQGAETPIPVNFTGAISGTYTTSEDGLIVKQYNGSGAGDVNVSAAITGSSSSLTIEDVLQYWRASGVSYNQEYTNVNGSLQSLSTGYKLTNGSTISVALDLSIDFEVSLSVVQAQSVFNEKKTKGQGYYWENVTYQNALLSIFMGDGFSVKANDVVRVRHQNGTYYIYRNSVLITSFSGDISGVTSFLMAEPAQNSAVDKNFVSSFVTFNYLKIKRL